MEIKGKLVVKARNGKGFKVEGSDEWFNADGAAVESLAKLSAGDDVVVTYEKEGIKHIVSKIEVGASSSPSQTEYKKPYNKSSYQKKSYDSSNYADNPAKTKQIQKGNALNAASAVHSGRTDIKEEELTERVLLMASNFFEWLREE